MTIYLMRHQDSEKGTGRYRAYDAPLATHGKAAASALVPLLSHLHMIDRVLCGTLSRQVENAEIYRNGLGVPLPLELDSSLNAVPRAPFFEIPGSETAEKDYGLEKYKAGVDGLYHGLDAQGRAIEFNPVALGIYPFDKFVCRANLNKRLRDMIFPYDKTLEQVERDIRGLHADLISKVQRNEKQLTILAVGSGSSNELMAEYAQYGTIGEHIIDYLSPIKKPIFTQKPNEMIVLTYNAPDLEMHRTRLRLAEKNIDVERYAATLPNL